MIEPSPGGRPGLGQVRLVNPERFSARVLYVVAEQFETAQGVRKEGAEEVSADRLIGFVSSPDAAGPAAKHSPPHQVPNSAKGTISMTQQQPGVTGATSVCGARGVPVESEPAREHQPTVSVAMSEW